MGLWEVGNKANNGVRRAPLRDSHNDLDKNFSYLLGHQTLILVMCHVCGTSSNLAKSEVIPLLS